MHMTEEIVTVDKHYLKLWYHKVPDKSKQICHKKWFRFLNIQFISNPFYLQLLLSHSQDWGPLDFEIIGVYCIYPEQTYQFEMTRALFWAETVKLLIKLHKAAGWSDAHLGITVLSRLHVHQHWANQSAWWEKQEEICKPSAIRLDFSCSRDMTDLNVTWDRLYHWHYILIWAFSSLSSIQMGMFRNAFFLYSPDNKINH